MLRRQIMKKHINVDTIFHVIWHNGSVFIKLTLRTLLFLLVLYVLFFVLNRYITREYFDWIFGILGLGFFMKYIVDFLNVYLDGLVLSNTGITLFMREWLFEYKTDFFEWTRIQAVSHNQNSFWDKLFARWDLMITLEHGLEYPFEDVNFPKQQADKIMKYKQQFSPIHNDDMWSISDDKMSIIAEALSEVVKEYMDKKNSDYEDEDL